MPDEMKRATEVFLAGTAAEITPVRQIGDLNFTPGRITETLLTDYEKLVRMFPGGGRDNGTDLRPGLCPGPAKGREAL